MTVRAVYPTTSAVLELVELLPDVIAIGDRILPEEIGLVDVLEVTLLKRETE